MKSAAFAFSFLFLSLLLFASGSLARNNPEEYWKEVMKDQPMPEVMEGLVVKDGSDAINNFARDFDVNPNVIIYHGRSNMDEAMTKTMDNRLN